MTAVVWKNPKCEEWKDTQQKGSEENSDSFNTKAKDKTWSHREQTQEHMLDHYNPHYN